MKLIIWGGGVKNLFVKPKVISQSSLSFPRLVGMLSDQSGAELRELRGFKDQDGTKWHWFN